MYIKMQPNVYKMQPNVYTPLFAHPWMYRVGYTLCCILYTLGIYIAVHFDVYTLGNIFLDIHCVTKNATQCICLATQCIFGCNPMYIPNVYWIYIGWQIYIHWDAFDVCNVYTLGDMYVTQCIYTCNPMYIYMQPNVYSVMHTTYIALYIAVHIYIHCVQHVYTL